MTAHLEGQQNIGRICANPEFEQLTVEDQYKSAISDLVNFELGLDTTSAAKDRKAISALLTTARQDLNAVYKSVLPSVQAAIDKVLTDIDGLEASAAALRQTVDDTTKTTLVKKPVSLGSDLKVTATEDAFNQFVALLAAVAPQIRGGMTKIESGVNGLDANILKIEQSTMTAAQAKMLKDDWDNLDAATKQMVSDVESLIQGKATALASDQNKKFVSAQLQIILNDLVTYETARILTLELSRAARSIEYKLDQVDEKTWFLVSLLELAASDSVEKKMAAKLHNAFLDKEIHPFSADLSRALVIASCAQIKTDTTNAPTNAVRATALLEPFYDAIICGLSENDQCWNKLDPKTGMAEQTPDAAAVQASSKVTYSLMTQIDLGAKPEQDPQFAKKKAAELTKDRGAIKQLVAHVVTKVKVSDCARKNYRNARRGLEPLADCKSVSG
jgi:hypothetical protein